jgi:hypothetical protein
MEDSMTKLGVVLKDITVKYDGDHNMIGPSTGPGEIYVKETVKGQLSHAYNTTNTYHLDDSNYPANTANLMGEKALYVDTNNSVSVKFEVFDQDWWPGSDLRLSSDYEMTFNTIAEAVKGNNPDGDFLVNKDHYTLTYDIFVV